MKSNLCDVVPEQVGSVWQHKTSEYETFIPALKPKSAVWLICSGRDMAWLDLMFTTIPSHMYLIMFRHKALIICGIDSDGEKRGQSRRHLQQPHCEMYELWAISHFISQTLPNTVCTMKCTRSLSHTQRPVFFPARLDSFCHPASVNKGPLLS